MCKLVITVINLPKDTFKREFHTDNLTDSAPWSLCASAKVEKRKLEDGKNKWSVTAIAVSSTRCP